MPTFKPLSVNELANLRDAREVSIDNVTEGMNPNVRGSSLGAVKRQRIDQMGFQKELLGQVSKTVQSLTVGDLEDLAKRFSGGEVVNKRLDALKVEDIQGIHMIFDEQRQNTLVHIADRLVTGGFDTAAAASVDVSCCCCTPCCCCAATETNPFAQV